MKHYKVVTTNEAKADIMRYASYIRDVKKNQNCF